MICRVTVQPQDADVTGAKTRCSRLRSVAKMNRTRDASRVRRSMRERGFAPRARLNEAPGYFVDTYQQETATSEFQGGLR